MSQVIHGYHPVREALRHRPHEVLEVFVSSRRDGARNLELRALCSRHGVRLTPLAPNELSRFAPADHQGFAARLRQIAVQDGGPYDPGLLVLVEDVQDPRNLGALLRVCEGAGVGQVMIRDRGSASLSAAVVKTSTGATEWLAVERITNTAATLRRLKKEGYWIYGAASGGLAPWTVDLRGRVVLVVGGEEKGLRHQTRRSCDVMLGLPMRGRLTSLNLATAAAAILYEAVRQREGLPGEGQNG